jgi:aspartyl/asparaginyl beta-hydroxylase (cupin superfamily)
MYKEHPLLSEALTKVVQDFNSWINENGIEPADVSRLLDAIKSSTNNSQNHKNTNQRPNIYIPELTASAWHNPNEFSWTSRLHDSYDIIFAEYKALAANAKFKQHPTQELLENGQWSILPLFSFGHKHEDNCGLLPRTTELIESIPSAADASLVYMSSLAPKTIIKPHYGPMNLRLRCHYGLSVPENCTITVGGETQNWQEGKCIIFDDSFIHEVRNGSDCYRDVLIIDFWHPDLTVVEKQAAEALLLFFRKQGILNER